MAAPLATARPISIAIALALTWVHLAGAQTTVDAFAELPQVIERGTNVIVEGEGGERTKGKVVELSDATLQLMTGVSGRRVSFAPDQVRRVMKVDSRLNGFLIGAAAGVVPGVLLGMGFKTYCSNEATSCPAAPAILGTVFGLAGGGLGYAIDGAINGQTLVYSRRPQGSLGVRLRF